MCSGVFIEVMGFISEHVEVNIQYKKETLHVPHFETHIEERRRGLGHQAIERLKELAMDQNKSKITIRISRTNPALDFQKDPSVEFLKKEGFKVEDEGDTVFGTLKL